MDDPEYKPGGKPRPIITGTPVRGEVFDVTVSAIQGPGATGSGAPPTVGTAHIYPGENFSITIFKFLHSFYKVYLIKFESYILVILELE